MAMTLRQFQKQFFPFPHEIEGAELLYRFQERSVLDNTEVRYNYRRGDGATTSSIITLLWIALEGIRPGVAYFAKTQNEANWICDRVLNELMTSIQLHEAYPEACEPFRRKRFRQAEVMSHPGVLRVGTIDPIANGSAIGFFGLKSSFRGLCFRRSDDTSFRISHVILDTVESDPDRNSVTMTMRNRDRIKLIKQINSPNPTSSFQLVY